MLKPNLNKTALRRSFFGSIARLLGTVLAAGSGSILHQLIGNGINGWGVAALMAIASFLFIWAAEYKKES